MNVRRDRHAQDLRPAEDAMKTPTDAGASSWRFMALKCSLAHDLDGPWMFYDRLFNDFYLLTVWVISHCNWVEGRCFFFPWKRVIMPQIPVMHHPFPY